LAEAINEEERSSSLVVALPLFGGRRLFLKSRMIGEITLLIMTPRCTELQTSNFALGAMRSLFIGLPFPRDSRVSKLTSHCPSPLISFLSYPYTYIHKNKN
jgi:hypothetical protein